MLGINFIFHRYRVYSYDNETNAWFSEAIGRTCSLLRYSSFNQDFLLKKIKGTATCRDMKNKLNFANEAQFLLVSEESVSDLNRRLSSGMLMYPFSDIIYQFLSFVVLISLQNVMKDFINCLAIIKNSFMMHN